jgi:hypothetical protein
MTALVGPVLAEKLLFAVSNGKTSLLDQAMSTTSTRRKFLTGVFATAAGAGIAGGLSLSASIKEKTGSERNENSLGFALYTLYDYREAVVAEALNELSQRNLGHGPITVVYGSDHLPGIQHYLHHPVERSVRLLSYAPLAAHTKTGTHLYRFDQTWKEI